ncbi:hypothetical protein, partial [Erythrobacter donghaensis]
RPAAIYAPSRVNSRGWDLANRADLNEFLESRGAFADHQWQAAPILAVEAGSGTAPREVFSPAQTDRQVGTVTDAGEAEARAAIAAARIWDT